MWAERRRYDATDFPLDCLKALKRETSIAVVIPAKECAATIAGVIGHTVGPAARAGLIDEIVVVDADSADGTAAIARAAGARVVQQDEVLAGAGPTLGKGDAMWRSLAVTGGQIVCFLDGDTADPDPCHLQGLIGPLLLDPDLTLVKGAFERPLVRDGVELAHEGGRVTELMARPLLNLYEPRLAGFMQPLAGEFAARRGLLEAIPFPAGYGVEIAVLIDALRRCGLDALAECHLGVRHNRHQPLRALGEMAYAVLAAVERRVGDGRAVLGGHYLRPWEDGTVVQVTVEERPPLANGILRGARPGQVMRGSESAGKR
jgi:glucosyl-3-phosphoglycerate synthase